MPRTILSLVYASILKQIYELGCLYFQLKKRVSSVEEIDDDLLVDIGSWDSIKNCISAEFRGAVYEEGICKINTPEFEIEIFQSEDTERISTLTCSLYGEKRYLRRCRTMSKKRLVAI